MLLGLIFFWKSNSAMPPVSKIACVVDTEKILSNKSLPAFIRELEHTKLKVCRNQKCIPPFVMEFLKCTARQEGTKYALANPGEEWQVTDVVYDETLPERQLAFIGISDSLILMTNYTGGIGRAGHILLFKVKGSKIIDFWSGIMLEDIRDEAQVLKFLKENQHKKEALNSNYVYF